MDLRNEVDTFDPGLSASDQGAMQMFEAIYDTPVRQDYKTGGVTAAIATEWDVTPTKVVFQLRPDLKCSDGTALPPTDVAKGLLPTLPASPMATTARGTSWFSRFSVLPRIRTRWSPR